MPPKKKKETEKTEIVPESFIDPFGQEFDLGDIGEATIYREYAPIRGIPTGSLTVDWAFSRGQGVPRGAFLLFNGTPGSGKSTLSTMIGANAVAQKLKVSVIPSEGRWNQEYAYNSGMGMPGKDYLLIEPMYAEGVCNTIVALAEKGYDLCIIDSITAISPKEEKDAGLDEQSYAKTAKLFSEFFRKRMYKVSNSDLCVIMIAQYRTKIGVMYGSPRSRPGGEAIQFYSSICVDFENGAMDYENEADKKEKRNPYGFTLRANVWKNSIAPPYRPIELPIRFINGLAIDQAEEIIEFGKQFGIFVGKTGGEISGGSHWYYNGDLMGTSRQEAKGKVANDPDLMVELTAKIREQMRQR